ncbi:MAG TPA: FtsX-like permease family protein [Burkholderiales bacterium]|jgi:putative ABC transport system permease protein|nr:FtsX-like permease family protein [Burkholderiales bacterium]
MNLARISLSYLRARNMSTVLNVVLLAFAVAAITMLVLTSEQLEERMYFDARGIDLVAGAKGSPLQTILSSVYQLDQPVAGIPWSAAQAIAARPGVKKAIPIAAVDNYHGLPLVGATADYLAHYRARLRAGQWWQAPLDALVGSEAAARAGLRVGSTFRAVHGAGESPGAVHDGVYRVVGVLWPNGTVLDRIIVTDIANVWSQHADTGESEDGLVREPPIDAGREISALLIQTTSAEAAAALARELNSGEQFQAISPGAETARLFEVLVVGMQLLRGFAIVLVIAAGLSVFIALYSALNERRYDLAIMRALGASPRRLMVLLLFEGTLLAAIGTVFGVLLGHLLTSILGFAFRFEQVGVTGWLWSRNELWVIGGALAVGMLAALLPAWRAHEIDIAQVLARG